MHLPSLAQRLTSERNQAAAATHNNTHRFSGRTGYSIAPAPNTGDVHMPHCCGRMLARRTAARSEEDS